jgi:7,8-dihydropterin-6-yl-methyl-4-(beta-D-ribofuranosyl)aminobenzene 5'-phosphate synthase
MQADAKTSVMELPVQQTHWLFRPCEPQAGVGITGPIPRQTTFEDVGGPFHLDPRGTRPDPIEDDTALWVETNKGLVILTGCCHAGLVNTVNYVRKLAGQSRVRAIIGGLHLATAARERLGKTCQCLADWDVETVVPCHCTGDEAVAFMRERLGRRVVPGRAGFRWTG